MPFNLGPGELIVLAVAALLLFGPQKLPEIGRSLGEALGSLKKAYNSAANLEETKPAATVSDSPSAKTETNSPTQTASTDGLTSLTNPIQADKIQEEKKA
ncbi:MAG: twin-arginine translocase TatA/TatE family subunit [Candidatus Bruticola sp.]